MREESAVAVSSFPVLGCSGIWKCACESVFTLCEREYMYLRLSQWIWKRLGSLTKRTAFPLERGVCGFESKSVCVCASALICRQNADLSIKADLSYVLPTDVPVITTLSWCFPKGTAQPPRQVDRDWYTHAPAYAHTHTHILNLIGVKELT